MGGQYFILFAVLSGALADTSTTGIGMTVSWVINGSDITFTTIAAKSILDSGAGWWGWGINSSSSMAGADIYMFYKDGTGANQVVDSYATSNVRPGTDSVSSITVSSHAVNGDGTFTSVFSRPLDTSDTSQDKTLVVDSSYTMIFAYGTLSGSGAANYHSNLKGSNTFTLGQAQVTDTSTNTDSTTTTSNDTDNTTTNTDTDSTTTNDTTTTNDESNTESASENESEEASDASDNNDSNDSFAPYGLKMSGFLVTMGIFLFVPY